MNRAGDVRAAYPLLHAEGGGSTPTSALDLRVYEIPTRTAQDLNRMWHSVLPITTFSSLKRSRYAVSFGAEFDNVFYAVGIWTHPIAANRLKDADKAMELRRFAIAPDAPRFTASRMLRVMEILIRRKFPDVRRLLSYQAVVHHDGIIYRAAGWSPVAKSKFMEWKERKNRPVHYQQTVSDKVRWERML